MVDLRQLRGGTPGLRVGAAAGALALVIALVLTVFTTDAAHAQSFQVLYAFTGGLDGGQPYSGLTINSGGDLFGTTHAGNQGINWGQVYELRRTASGYSFADLALFDGALDAPAVFGPNGTIYSTSPNNLTIYQHGYVLNVSPPANPICFGIPCLWNATVLYGFSGGADGNGPRYGALIFDQAGNMYGTASTGGSGNGVVYEMTGSGTHWTEHAIYPFAGSPDGANPYSGVIFDSAGNLYGTTTAGGASGNGAVYELSPSGSGWTERVIYSFTGGSDGSYPTAGLIFDGAGNLYGSTNVGGTGGGGTVFELSPSGGSWNYSLLYSFTGGANCGPWAPLTLNGGNLYDTTVCDGANSAGNVFELSPSGNSWSYTSLYDFTGGNDGKFPYGSVSFDAAGNIYGTTLRGGLYLQGLAWKITP
jgi:uncharacterized repeat protein (TIGR03803 family)